MWVKERVGREEPQTAGVGHFEKEFYCNGKRGYRVIAGGESGVNRRLFFFNGKNTSICVY